MMLTMISDSQLSSQRIEAFIMLPDRDKEFTIYSHLLTAKQQDDFNKVVPEDTAVLVTGKPSFCWSNREDRKIPPILDPFFK